MKLGAARRQSRGWLAWGGVACLAVGAWRSLPQEQASPQVEPLVVLLFDVSAGTTRLRPGHGLWARQVLREEARTARAAGERLAVGLYGAEVRAMAAAPAQDWLARVAGRDGEALNLGLPGGADLGSELDAGLALFESPLIDAAPAGARLVLCAAPDVSGADPRPRLARLAAGGVILEWRELPPPARVDLAVEAVRLPDSPQVGAPLLARVDLALESGGAAPPDLELLVLSDGTGGAEERRVELELPATRPAAGRTRWSTRLDLGPTAPGRTRVSVRARLAGGSADAIPENDLRSATCRAGEARLLGAVAPPALDGELRAFLREASARWPGVEVLFLEPAAMPATLPELDLLLTLDLAPAELPADALREFLRGGGGWLACGGWRAWPPRAWHDPPAGSVVELLPLVPAPREGGPRDLIFVVDGSGSMAGEPFERVQRSLARILLGAGPEEHPWLRFFTGSLLEPVDLGAPDGDASERLAALFAARVPGGPTAILYSLEQLVREREESARPALTFLLSDGRDDVAHDVPARGAGIAAALSRGESRLVVVAAGEEADRELLAALLPPGGRLRQAGEEEELSELFQREVFRERVQEGALALELADAGELPGSEELLAAWRAAESLPRHERVLRSRSREGGEVLWRSAETGEPWLAWWRVGSGRVAAWASAPLEGWAPAFAEADDLLGPLWRVLARPAGLPAGTRLVHRDGRLVLEGVPADWPAEVRAELRAHLPLGGAAPGLVASELGQTLLLLPADSPGTDPRERRVGELAAGLVAGFPGRPLWARLVGPSGAPLGQAALDLPCPAELEPVAARELGPWDPPDGNAQALPRGGAPDPWAWIWLLIGLLATSAAALAGALDGRAPGSSPARRPGGRQGGAAAGR